MTSLAGNKLRGIAKKRETTMNSLPSDIGLVTIEANTTAFICLSGTWSTSSR
jgi:hypothetical protein